MREGVFARLGVVPSASESDKSPLAESVAPPANVRDQRCACGHPKSEHETFGAGPADYNPEGQCWECDREGHGVPCVAFVPQATAPGMTALWRELKRMRANDALHAATSLAVCACGHAHPVNLRGTPVNGCSTCGCGSFELAAERTLERIRRAAGAVDVEPPSGTDATRHDVERIRGVLFEELSKLSKLEAMACPSYVRANQLTVVLGAFRAYERAARIAGARS